MKKIIWISALLALLLGLNAQASNPATDALQTVTPNESTNTLKTLLPSVKAPQIGAFKLQAGVNSTNDSGRQGDTQSSRYNYSAKHEYYAGIKHNAGWGLSAMAVQSGKTKENDADSYYGASDSSASLEHPIYKDDNWHITGRLRRYFAVTERSKNREQKAYAYYVFSNYKMAHEVNVFNQFTPRYFGQSYYKSADSKYAVEDYTFITKAANSWFKYGVGHHTQMEWHDKTATGAVIQVFPLVNFSLNKNIFIEPHVLLPVYSNNVVYDSPRAASLDNVQLEVFAHASL